MQGKGLIKTFLVLLILVSLLQLFYMFPTRNVEKQAVQYADEVAANYSGDEAFEARKSAKMNFLDSISSEDIMTIPLIGKFSYEDLKSRQLALGLDLKGGMSSVLQVDLKDLLLRLSRQSKDESFRSALDSAEKGLESSQKDYITLFRDAYFKIKDDNKKSLASIFKRDASMSEVVDLNMNDTEVIRILREKADETVNLTFGRLKQRIDKLGVVQPNISLDKARDLILVELPGVENPERAKSFLQASAALEFWNTYRTSDPTVSGKLLEADRILKSLQTGEDVMDNQEAKFDTIYTPVVDSLGNDTGETTMSIQPKVADPFANQGPLLSLLRLNTGQFSPVVFGFAEKNKRKAISEMLANPAVKSIFPTDSKFLWSRSASSFGEDEVPEYELYLIRKQGTSDKALIEGDVITRTGSGPNPTGQIAVNLSMNNKGAQRWKEMTTEAYNNGGREIAICIDDEVVSAPGVNNGPIDRGSTEITGNFSVQEAQDFANILEVGKLPAKLKIIQSETVGPSLGAKNIDSSIKALIIGFLIVLLFMIFYYGGGGIVSILALLLNVFFIFGALASFGTVLTLPGIAGIVLTIGMAVDANVIIYERIREEVRVGKTMLASINDGFKNSYSAIIDANVTTILVAAVLFYFGLGPIKGFATVLIIGVLTSLFTAVLVGKMIIDWWTKGERGISFWTAPSKNLFSNLQIDWMGKRKIAYFLSGTLLVVGIASMFIRGFDLGVDFKGGYSYNIKFDDSKAVDAQTLRTELAKDFGSVPVVKAVDTRNSFNIVTSYLINDNSDDASDRAMEKLYEGVINISGATTTFDHFRDTEIPGEVTLTSSSKVGPTIADDIKTSSLYAGLFSLLLIFLYIFIRFNKWQFSMGAVAALFHDSLIVLGLFSLLWNILPISLEVNQAFIAAILTVIGYSINDTVIVFDRIREYLGIYTQKPVDEVLNMAINSTFSRTIITSLTTIVMLLPLFIFGGGSIRGFAFAIIIGILVGTYSSIFVATPIVRDLSKDLSMKSKKSVSKKSFSSAAESAK
ncbi:protein translocase subunit SecDF [Saprospiraceae bacterium]|nr:protein translocase subunit SecDF [Saprospiraceae bacterium]